LHAKNEKSPVSRAFRVERTGIEPVTSGLQSAPGEWPGRDNRGLMRFAADSDPFDWTGFALFGRKLLTRCWRPAGGDLGPL